MKLVISVPRFWLSFVSDPLSLPSPPPRQKLITAARYMGVGVINYRGGATNSHLYRHTQKFMEHVLCAVWEIIPGLITKPARARACLQLWGNKMAITNEGRIVPQFFSLLLAISFFFSDFAESNEEDVKRVLENRVITLKKCQEWLTLFSKRFYRNSCAIFGKLRVRILREYWHAFLFLSLFFEKI